MANFLDLIKGEGPAVELIKSLVDTVSSGAEILRQVRESGLGISNSTGYQVINYLRDTYLPSTSALKNLANDTLPTINSIPKSVTELLRNFSYKVAVTGSDINTGETRKQYIQISSNQLLTKQQALDAASNIVEQSSKSGGITFDEADVESIQQNNAGLTDTNGQLSSEQLNTTPVVAGSNQTISTSLPFGYDSWTQYYKDIYA